MLLIDFLFAIENVYRSASAATAWALAVAAALLTLAFLARTMALTVQDRVIRLEMRLRLHEALPADLRNRIHELTPRQLVALRFASDAEMPEWYGGTRRKLVTSKAIKGRVKDWQGDYLRAKK